MGFWEFLIQKEGDRSWLPLESPDVEVLEGRYRVVARSSYVNTPVEIRITQDAIAEDPPKRRVQKRTSKTNPDGLIVVMPFTRLQPGIWELRCTSDVMADMLGEPWRHTVNLQVLSLDVGDEEDWEDDSDWGVDAHELRQVPADEQTDSDGRPMGDRSTLANSSSPALIEASEAVETTQVQLSEDDVDEAAGASVPQAHQPEELFTEAQPSAERATWQLVLQSDTYGVQRGQTLTLRGEIVFPPEQTTPVFLQVRLWDPQTAEILHDRADPVPMDGARTDFCCAVTIPSDCQTRLMLGELHLVAHLQPDAAPPATLASQPFAVTVNLDELLEAIADSYPEANGVQPPLEFVDTAEVFPLALEFLNLVNQPQAELTTQPVADAPLPPQLYQPDPASPRTRVELPVMPPDPAEPSEIESDSKQAEAAAPELTDAEFPADVEASGASDQLESVESPDIPVAERQPMVLERSDSEGTAVALAAMTDIPSSSEAIAPSPAERPITHSADALLEPAADVFSPAVAPSAAPLLFTPELESFRELNLSQRFWAKLQGFLSEPAEVKQSGSAATAIASTLQADAMPDLTDHEFVVDDDSPPAADEASPSTVAEVEEPHLDKHQPIPIPHLLVTEGELIAGQPVFLVVTLPILETRLSAKVWFRDRQSRTLLEGPRWLVDFVPNGLGEQQSRLQISAPYGCTHIQIEAIAVEMATQRESHKVSLERSVVPADLPALLLDDLGL